MLIMWLGGAIDGTRIKANIEKEMKDRITRNTHGTVCYETISMSELQPRNIPFYCTPEGTELADSIYEQSESQHLAIFNAIIALKASKDAATSINIEDTTRRLKAAEKEYKKALHRCYLKEAATYSMKPDTQYHLKIVYRLTRKNNDGSMKQMVDSAEYTVNAKSLEFEREDEFSKVMMFLPTGCDHNGWLMLEYPDEENWAAQPPPPPDFH